MGRAATLGLLLVAAVDGSIGVAWVVDQGLACASELNAVDTAIVDGVFLGKNASTDESNLRAKLEAAAAKVGLRKYDDAVDKLHNISDTATALANAPKQKLEDASGINEAVRTAISCIGGL